MTPYERGFLLLACSLGNPQRPVLSSTQLKTLSQRVQIARMDTTEGQLTAQSLKKLGYTSEMAQRIAGLLEEGQQLEWYIQKAAEQSCKPITRANPAYPLILRKRLGSHSPACFWYRGDLSILTKPAISLVGSREPGRENAEFAQKVGREAAKQGLALVSGNARGCDRLGQEACLEAGGCVISFVADELYRHPERANILYLSESDFDAPFSAYRALSRNHCIHAMGRLSFVAQAELEKGGSWNGSAKNLRYGWSPLMCLDDGSSASCRLEELGAYLISGEEPLDFQALLAQNINFLDP